MNTTYLTRMDYARVQGWAVRMPGTSSKLFSDSIYGSNGRARRAAIAYRDFIAAGKALPKVRIRHKTSPRNISGKIGVSKNWSQGKFTGWAAYAQITLKTQTKILFPFRKYGRANARKLADECRSLMEQIVELQNHII